MLSLNGKSGVGKTEIGKKIAEAIGYEFDPKLHVKNFCGASPVEGTGYGVPGEWDDDLGSDIDMRFSVPEGLPTLAKYGDRKIVFMCDEFSNWDPTLQSLALGAMTPVGFPKKWGPHDIAPNVFFVLTSNRRSDGSRQSSVLSAPNVARCLTLVIEPNLKETLEHFAVDKDLSDSAHWKFLSFVQLGNVNGNTTGALDAEKLFAPDPVTPWDGMPYPNPRQHERVCMATMPDSPLMDDTLFNHEARKTNLSGYLGPDAGAEVASWIAVMADSVENAKAVLAGAASFPKDTKSIYGTMMAAYRLTKMMLSGMTQAQRLAAVKGGDVDDFVNRIMLVPEAKEYCAWLYEMAIREDKDKNSAIPLDVHPMAEKMQCV
jgi:hypothetical protein